MTPALILRGGVQVEGGLTNGDYPVLVCEHIAKNTTGNFTVSGFSDCDYAVILFKNSQDQVSSTVVTPYADGVSLSSTYVNNVGFFTESKTYSISGNTFTRVAGGRSYIPMGGGSGINAASNLTCITVTGVLLFK